MSAYDLHFNKDNVALRNILVGSLATLADHIGWNNQVGTSIEQKLPIRVPFYFSTTGSERYLNDNFLNNIDFDPQLLQAEAFYNQIPRGIVDFSSFSIETQAITNKYVRMDHIVQEDNGTLKQYNSEAFMVPILMSLKIEIYLDSILDQLKCSESLIRTFYKAKAYNVDIGYTRIPCLMLFPDEFSQERSVEFSFTDKKEFKVTFDIDIKSYIPIFKDGTTIFAGNNMGNIQSNISVTNGGILGSTSMTTNDPGQRIGDNALPAGGIEVGETSGINSNPSTNSYIGQSGYNWRGPWNAGGVYSASTTIPIGTPTPSGFPTPGTIEGTGVDTSVIVGDLVLYNGVSYNCILDVTDPVIAALPPSLNPTYWSVYVAPATPYNRPLGDIPSWPTGVDPSTTPNEVVSPYLVPTPVSTGSTGPSITYTTIYLTNYYQSFIGGVYSSTSNFNLTTTNAEIKTIWEDLTFVFNTPGSGPSIISTENISVGTILRNFDGTLLNNGWDGRYLVNIGASTTPIIRTPYYNNINNPAIITVLNGVITAIDLFSSLGIYTGPITCTVPSVVKFPDNQFTNARFVTIGQPTTLQITPSSIPTVYDIPNKVGFSVDSATGLITINYTGPEKTEYVYYRATNDCGSDNKANFFNFVNYDVMTLQAPIGTTASDINTPGLGKNFLYVVTALAYMGGDITHYEIWVNGVLDKDFFGANLGNQLGTYGDRITVPSSGNYDVKSRFKDEFGNYSPFSDTITVVVP